MAGVPMRRVVLVALAAGAALSSPVGSAQPVDVALLGDAHGDFAAVSGAGDATAGTPCTVQAEARLCVGGVAVSGAGDASVGPPICDAFACPGGVAVSPLGDANSIRGCPYVLRPQACLALSLTGDSTGGTAVTVLGNSRGEVTFSGVGTSDARGGAAAFSGTGDAVAPVGYLAVSGTGNSQGGVAAVSLTGDSESQRYAVSLTGHARGSQLAVSGCDLAGLCTSG